MPGDVSAVHVEDRAGDEVAGRQQERGVGDLFRLADAVEKVQPGQAVRILDAIPGV